MEIKYINKMFDEKMETLNAFNKAYYWIFNLLLLFFLLYKIWEIYKFRTEESEFYKTFLDNFKFNSSSNDDYRSDSNISEEKYI